MIRIKTTTSKGNVFLSPFVYHKDIIKKKLKRLKWLVKHKKAKMETVEVTKYPRESVYDWRVRALHIETLLKLLNLLEKKWEWRRYSNATNGKNFEEMEEGSA